MMSLAMSPNKLKQKVTDNKLGKRRTIWETMDVSEMPNFPQLNETELRDLTMGVYQIRQAKCYSKEHQTDAGKYEIFEPRYEETGFLHMRKQRRRSAPLFSPYR